MLLVNNVSIKVKNKIQICINIAGMFRIRFILIYLLLITACQPNQRYEGKSIFRFNMPEGITSLDPAFARSLDNVSAVNQLFNGLVQLDNQLTVSPCIAKAWEISDDGKRYRFNLRTDVFFHKSHVFGADSIREVIAKDIIYSFNRLVDESMLSPGKWVMNKVERTSDGKLKIIALNDSTIDIYLKQEFPPFLGILSMQYCAIVPKEAVDFYGRDFRENPVGTGPFQFKYWSENSKLVYLKNPMYFEKDENGNSLPYLDAIAISFIKDQEIAFLKFLKHEIDYLSGLKGSYKDELLNSRGELNPKYQSKVIFDKSPYLNTEYLGFYVDGTQSGDKQVLSKELRKAINYGFDRVKMLNYLRNGIGFPANGGFIPKGLPGFKITGGLGYTFQADSVKSLLKRAGYPNGQGLQPIVLSTSAEYLDICEYLQSQLADFGIPIEVSVNQAATNNQLIANGELEFFRKSWVADYPDAENYLSLFRSKNFAPAGPNYTHFSSSLYDSLYNHAMRITSDSIRAELYAKMDSIIIDEAPIVPLFYDELVRFTQPTISGIGVNPMNLLVLKYARKSEVN